MKYIRTKDGRIKEVRKGFEGKEWESSDEYFYKHYHSKGDTIEELCDGYVITSKQGHIYDSYGDYGYELKEVLPQAREECPDEEWDLYGCILVNGIIKQVAKMNEKGELELL